MRADVAFTALADGSNRYQLTKSVAKVTRMPHRPNTRVQDTMNEAFKWLSRFKPGAAKPASHGRTLPFASQRHITILLSIRLSLLHGEARRVNMAASFASVSLNSTPSTTLWGIMLLEHLDEFATLAWHLVADSKLVENRLSRTLAKLDTISFEASIPALTYTQARDVLVAQAIAEFSDMRIEEGEDWSVETNSIGRLPDLARLAFMLKLIIRSPKPEIAKCLGVSPHEVQALVEYAIDRLSVALPVA